MQHRLYVRLLPFLFLAVLIPVSGSAAEESGTNDDRKSFAEATAGLELHEGFINVYSDREQGKVLALLPEPDDDGTDNPLELAAVADSFANSFIRATEIVAEDDNGRALIDLAGLLTADGLGLAETLSEDGGEFKRVDDRSIPDVSSLLVRIRKTNPIFAKARRYPPLTTFGHQPPRSPNLPGGVHPQSIKSAASGQM